MQSLSARYAKLNYGRLMDLVLAKPVKITMHGRVVVVLAIKASEPLEGPDLRMNQIVSGDALAHG